jgi:hypothetical protein
MRADSDNGTLFHQVFDSGDGRADTGVISDFLSVKGNVNIATDQDLLSLELGVREVRDGLLGLKFEERRSSSTADTESRCLTTIHKIIVRIVANYRN